MLLAPRLRIRRGVSPNLDQVKHVGTLAPAVLLGLCLQSSAVLATSAGPNADEPKSPAMSVDPATRSSSLAQIDRHNVNQLEPVFTFRTGRLGAQGSAPLIRGDKLLVLSAFPHTLFAIGLARSNGTLSWQFSPTANRVADGLHCCDRTHLGPVAVGDRIYFSTLDGHVVAVDAEHDTPVWDVAVADPGQGETLASAPTAAAAELIVGNAGDDYGARGWIAALDRATGRTLWKHYSTGPDQDVGISADFKPAGPRDQGSHSWPGTAWQHGGGSVSGWISYDPRLQLVFHDTGPPAPWNPDPRPGDNRWTSGVFARDARTGEARWFVGLHPHALFPWRNGSANLLLDHTWEGAPRALLVHPDADGRLYVIDRQTGKILAADSYISYPRVARRASAEQTPRTNVQVRDVCPAWPGALGGDAALDQTTGRLYLPVSRLCMDLEGRSANYLQGTAFIGANVRVTSSNESDGAVVAWDVISRRAVWSIRERFPVASDVLVTAGGLVFYGTLDGRLKAVDAQSGTPLWQFGTSAPITGQPTTFVGPDGRQYVAVVAGASGPYGLAQQAWIDRRDATAARGLARVIANVGRPRDPSGTLYVFGLP